MNTQTASVTEPPDTAPSAGQAAGPSAGPRVVDVTKLQPGAPLQWCRQGHRAQAVTFVRLMPQQGTVEVRDTGGHSRFVLAVELYKPSKG